MDILVYMPFKVYYLFGVISCILIALGAYQTFEKHKKSGIVMFFVGLLILLTVIMLMLNKILIYQN